LLDRYRLRGFNTLGDATGESSSFYPVTDADLKLATAGELRKPRVEWPWADQRASEICAYGRREWGKADIGPERQLADLQVQARSVAILDGTPWTLFTSATGRRLALKLTWQGEPFLPLLIFRNLTFDELRRGWLGDLEGRLRSRVIAPFSRLRRACGSRSIDGSRPGWLYHSDSGLHHRLPTRPERRLRLAQMRSGRSNCWADAQLDVAAFPWAMACIPGT